jgi:ligand-binding SRPBCC domain-containing protein
MQFEASTVISAQPQHVWAVLVDVRRWPEWTASMRSVQPAEPGPIGAGSKVRIRQPKLPPVTWLVTEFEPGTSFTWVAKSLGATTVGWHRLETDGDRTTATLGLRQQGPLGKAFGLLGGRLIRRYITMEAEVLRRRCEGSAHR